MEKKDKKIWGVAKELPPLGTQLAGKYKRAFYYARIVSDKSAHGGKAIEYGGKRYLSMTAAAMAVTKNCVNGWTFWKIKEME